MHIRQAGLCVDLWLRSGTKAAWRSTLWHCQHEEAKAILKRREKCGPESGANLDLIFESRF